MLGGNTSWNIRCPTALKVDVSNKRGRKGQLVDPK